MVEERSAVGLASQQHQEVQVKARTPSAAAQPAFNNPRDEGDGRAAEATARRAAAQQHERERRERNLQRATALRLDRNNERPSYHAQRQRRR